MSDQENDLKKEEDVKIPFGYKSGYVTCEEFLDYISIFDFVSWSLFLTQDVFQLLYQEKNLLPDSDVYVEDFFENLGTFFRIT